MKRAKGSSPGKAARRRARIARARASRRKARPGPPALEQKWFVEAVYKHDLRPNLDATDEMIHKYAERHSSHSGADVGGACQRDVGFDCATFEEAAELQAKLKPVLELGVVHRLGIGHYGP